MRLEKSITIDGFGSVFYIGADPQPPQLLKPPTSKNSPFYSPMINPIGIFKKYEDELNFDQKAVTEILLSQLGSYGK